MIRLYFDCILLYAFIVSAYVLTDHQLQRLQNVMI